MAERKIWATQSATVRCPHCDTAFMLELDAEVRVLDDEDFKEEKDGG